MKQCKNCGREEWGFLSVLDGDGYCPSCARIHNTEKIKKLNQQIQRLQEQLSEANEIILWHAITTGATSNTGLCRNYLSKWGVK